LRHNGGTEPASAGATEANHDTLSQGSSWPSQDSYLNINQKRHRDGQHEWLPYEGEEDPISLFHRGHPIVLNKVMDKQTGYQFFLAHGSVLCNSMLIKI